MGLWQKFERGLLSYEETQIILDLISCQSRMFWLNPGFKRRLKRLVYMRVKHRRRWANANRAA